MKYLIIAAFMALVCLAGCRAPKTVYVPVEKTRTITKTKVDTVIEIRIERPPMSDTVVQVIRDPATGLVNSPESKLTNDVATSRAWVQDGKLQHFLEFLGDPIPWEHEAEVTVIRDSIPYMVPVPGPVVEVVPWWAKFLGWVGGIALLILAIIIATGIYKKFFKPAVVVVEKKE